MSERAKTVDKIKKAYTLREQQRLQIQNIYSRAYDHINSDGVADKYNPGSAQSTSVKSVTKEANGISFRIFMGTNPNDGELPSKYGSKASPLRQITVEFLKENSDRLHHVNTMGILRLYTENGQTVERGSTIDDRKVDARNIMTDHSDGLDQIDQILTQVFNI